MDKIGFKGFNGGNQSQVSVLYRQMKTLVFNLKLIVIFFMDLFSDFTFDSLTC